MRTRNEGNQDRSYGRWHDLYYLLSTLALDCADIRHSPQTLQRFHDAGWHVNDEVVERYWRRVTWMAAQCRGRVLEVGAGMGNVTRWIVANPAVSQVVAVEMDARYAQALKGFAFPKVTVICADARKDCRLFAHHGPFDTVFFAELIEHLSFFEEVALLRACRRAALANARWVISTPIGFMADPDHQRGFSAPWFKARSRLLYGPITAKGDNGIQQFVVCQKIIR
jgi:2-polyprenyl-3-methyl-5-hydroxy-6-metoxy-1,4-benzoquinol methylase